MDRYKRNIQIEASKSLIAFKGLILINFWAENVLQVFYFCIGKYGF